MGKEVNPFTPRVKLWMVQIVDSVDGLLKVNVTICWKAVEQYVTVLLFIFRKVFSFGHSCLEVKGLMTSDTKYPSHGGITGANLCKKITIFIAIDSIITPCHMNNTESIEGIAILVYHAESSLSVYCYVPLVDLRRRLCFTMDMMAISVMHTPMMS